MITKTRKILLFLISFSLIILLGACTNRKDEKDIKSVIEQYNKTLEESYLGKEVENSMKIFLNESILDKANWRNKFIHLLYSDSNIKKLEQPIVYQDISIKKNYARVITNIRLKILHYDMEKPEGYDKYEAYLLKKTNSKWKIHSIFESDLIPEKEKTYQDFINDKDFVKYGERNSGYYLGDDTSENVYKERYYIWLDRIQNSHNNELIYEQKTSLLHYK